MTTPVTMSHSRAIPVDPTHAMGTFLAVPLTDLFTRRYGPLPPVGKVRDLVGDWDAAGDTRVIVTTDRGTMRETLTLVDPPRAFTYRIDELTGPLKPLVSRIDGAWEFAPAGTGTEVTWRWQLHPATGAARPAVRMLARFWQGYARQALEETSRVLLARPGG